MSSTDRAADARPWILASRGFAAATVVVVITLFASAGSLVQAQQLRDVHGTAAIALHVVSGGLMVALAGLAYSRKRGWWTIALAGVVFVYSFIQASLGSGLTIGAHILGSLLIAGGAIWLASWLFSSAPSGN